MHAVLSPPSSAPPSTPGAAGLVLEPLDGSAARRLTLWQDPADATAEQSRSGGLVYEIEQVQRCAPPGVPAVASLTEFGGPRDAVQVHADQQATERIWAAVSSVPGVLGAVVLRAPDGAMAVVAFAESTQALATSVRTLLSTPLLPGEDPALLTGPDAAVDCRVTGAELIDLLRVTVPA